MAKSIPSIQDAQQSYVTGTQARAQKWEARTAAAANAWEAAAKSPEAEQAYAQGVQMAAQNQLRLKGLANVSAAQFQSAVRGRAGLYQQQTQAKAGKWAAKFSPYLDIIRSVAPALPARVPGDVVGNIQRRVVPIAQALHNAKVGGATFTRPVPSATMPAGKGELLARPITY